MLAAGTNFVLISQATKTVEVVTGTKDVAEGERLTPDCLGTLKVRADTGLFNAVVRSEDRTTLHKQSLARSLKKGGLVFRADVVDPDGLMNGNNLKPGDPMVLSVSTSSGRKAHAVELGSGQLKELRFLGAAAMPQNNRAREPRWRVVFAAKLDDPAVRAFVESFTNPGENVISISKYVPEKSAGLAKLPPG